MSELSYIDEQGNNVFTAQYYRNRGTCCRSNCLHCPFGTTLKNCGLQFEAVGQDEKALAQEVIDESRPSDSSLGSSLLASAFGGHQKKTTVNNDNCEHFRFVYLKGKLCGVVEIRSSRVKNLFLKKRFNDQGITEDVVESFF